MRKAILLIFIASLSWKCNTSSIKQQPLKKEYQIHGIILDQKKKVPIQKAKINLIGNDGTEVIKHSTEEGKFQVMLKKTSNYRLSISAENYLTEHVDFSSCDNNCRDTNKIIYMEPSVILVDTLLTPNKK